METIFIRALAYPLTFGRRQIVAGFCIVGLATQGMALSPVEKCCGGGEESPSEQSGPGRTTTVIPRPPLTGEVNLTVPKVVAPGPALDFSRQPTAEEFFHSRLFEEPLVPIGGKPSVAENAALASALRGYAQRKIPDDFSSLDAFLAKYPKSPWRAALLTNLGLEAYRTGRYSRTIDSWAEAWRLAEDATDATARALADRAAGELVSMHARLGHMTELGTLLQSVEGRVFTGAATERITEARGGLWMMKNDPGVSFRCGPLALHRIQVALDPQLARTDLVLNSKSTTDGFSLAQVVKLSEEMGLKYRAAFREAGAPFVVPSVVHWKVGHYAAIIREENGSFLVQDPTFRNDVWITRAGLDAEASGYFVIPPGELAAGWRAVDADEGGKVWGKGHVDGPDPHGGKKKPKPKTCKGMAVSDVDLLFVSLELTDAPVGYTPPVGPAVNFEVSYNQREAAQPANFTYSNFGSKWTFDWLSYIQDNPANLSADVIYYQRGGFTRLFSGFSAATQGFALQPYDRTKLVRTSPTSYVMNAGDGSKMIFSQSDGSAGTARKIFLKQIVDPQGNAVTLTYDASLRLVAVADAIGQVTTLAYTHPTDIYKITKVTDPFGRFATFEYDASNRLVKIIDVIGIVSQFTYQGASDFINGLITPYGTKTFIKAEGDTSRSLDTVHQDGNQERVEFQQDAALENDPAATVPVGMPTLNQYLRYRNTYVWDEITYAAFGTDRSKAKNYHWLHATITTNAAAVLESEKSPLENRVWYAYPGQSGANGVSPVAFLGTHDQPSHIGRVLDDGTTQLSTYEYNSFGKMTHEVDPVGRTFTYIYAANGQDVIEKRMTRNGASELLFKTTYNTKHRPLTTTDAAGQITTYTYNARGQLLTATNAKGEQTTYTYNALGQLVSADGPLPGAGDQMTWTYDVANRVRTVTNESGYTLTYDYDNLDRLTRITFPDTTYEQYSYTRLDHVLTRDRAARETSFEYNNRAELIKRTDPLNRVTRYQWCKCGDLKSLTDPLGRTTTWRHDIQGRVMAKENADASRINYQYENTTSRLRQQIDEKQQVTQYSYTADDKVAAMHYSNTPVATPSVAYTYDADYDRVTSMTDGSGTTLYNYVPVGPTFGAGGVATIDGPLPNDTITYTYDALSRQVGTSIGGDARQLLFDPAGRVTGVTNALGAFTFAYDGASARITSAALPNSQTMAFGYEGDANDRRLNRITHTRGSTALSEFLETHDATRNRVTGWSQQAGTASPVSFALGYNAVNELLSSTGTQNASVVKTFAYAYDPGQNRTSEQVDGGALRIASHNALNELTAVTNGTSAAATYEWDAAQRLAAVNSGTLRTEFTYDGLGRRVRIRELNNAVETSDRRFVWCGGEICEERAAAGSVVKRFFALGVKVESGAAAGKYFYTKDHLGSIRELVDEAGAVRARYEYEPYGARTKVSGDLDADFGFTGHLTHATTGLCLTWYRAYDPRLGRWLSRDPFPGAEAALASNLYAYAYNDPINHFDPDGRDPVATGVVVAEGLEALVIPTLIITPIVQTAIVALIREVENGRFGAEGSPDSPPSPAPPAPAPPAPAPPAPAPPAPAPPAPAGPAPDHPHPVTEPKPPVPPGSPPNACFKPLFGYYFLVPDCGPKPACKKKK
jgi:RHS repeat-associated protein